MQELYVFLSEVENFTQFNNIHSLIWYLDDVTFGTWDDGPYRDGSRIISIDLNVPEVYNNNVCIVSAVLPGPSTVSFVAVDGPWTG